MIEEVRAAVSIPVMAKCRIGHFVEAQILEVVNFRQFLCIFSTFI
jgi:pyridoxal 5'-phosphate synthase pdxS subunit